MQRAIEHARAAVENDSSEVRHWHLLGLLLAATDDWRAAKGVLEIGIGMAEVELVEDDRSAMDVNGSAGDLNIRDFAHTNGAEEVNHNEDGGMTSDEVESTTVIAASDSIIPPSTGLLQAVKDRPAPTRQENFEYALQMRMTQLALAEFVEGAEGVGEKWLEVFQWFREKRPASMDDSESSSTQCLLLV